MNRRAQILVALGVVVAVWLAIVYWPQSYRNLPPKAGRTWVAFGDSLTAGVGAAGGHDYPTLLGQRLGVSIINRGVPGETTVDALGRVDQVLADDPRVVLLCLGGNDELRGMPQDQTRANLSIIIDQLQERGAFVVLIGIRSATIFDQNKGMFKRLARRHHAFYIPNMLEDVFAHARLMSDAVHPNDDGYAVIAERLEKILRPLMPRLQLSEEASANAQ